MSGRSDRVVAPVWLDGLGFVAACSLAVATLACGFYAADVALSTIMPVLEQWPAWDPTTASTGAPG